MTTIAACAVDGRVFMAADSMTNVYDRPVLTARKIRRITVGDQEALIGCAGEGGFAGMLIDFTVKDPHGDPDIAALDVAVAVTELAVDRGLVENGRLDGNLLLGYRGRLWTLTHAQAIAHEPQIAALGSGEGPAMGAMHALLDQGCDPGQAVQHAVRIAIGLDRYSGGPIRAELLVSADGGPSPGGDERRTDGPSGGRSADAGRT